MSRWSVVLVGTLPRPQPISPVRDLHSFMCQLSSHYYIDVVLFRVCYSLIQAFYLCKFRPDHQFPPLPQPVAHELFTIPLLVVQNCNLQHSIFTKFLLFVFVLKLQTVYKLPILLLQVLPRSQNRCIETLHRLTNLNNSVPCLL